MSTYKGPFSKDTDNKENVNAGAGLDRDSYYPAAKPGGKLQSDSQKGRIFLKGIDDDTTGPDAKSSGSEWAAGSRANGGFSGVVSRNKKG